MMDARRWQSPAAEAAAAEAAEEDAGVTGYGGAGGPSRRPPRRGLHRASPYGLGPRRWLPKLPVASRIFPTVSRDHTASGNNEMDPCESQEVTHESQSTETNANAVANAVSPPVNNKVNMLLEGDYRNQNDGSGLAEIEKIIKQSHFSRDETEHLIEIMRSRTLDLCDEDKRAPRSFAFAKGFEATAFSDKLSTPAKPADLRSSWGTGIFAPSNVHDAGSSPIELAKAYMEAQISASVHESQRRKFRALSHGVEGDNSSSNFFPKVAMDSPVCWPGSVVRDYPNDLTPQSNKGRTLPPTSSHTPYTGSVFTRSIKHTGYRDTNNNSSGRAQLSNFPVGSKAILEDKMASTGGVLALQPSTSSKGTYTDTAGATTPFFPRDGSASMKNLTFSLQGPHGKGTIESGSTVGRVSVVDNMSKRAVVSVHPKSSQTAHKILQHLERTIPSPTAKPLELRQTSAKRTTHSFVTNSQYKVPDSVTSNGHKQSSMNDSGSAHQEISDVNKAPPSSSNAELTPKIQNGGSNSEVTEMLSSRHPLKSDSTSASTAEVVDKGKNNGFTFTFPVTIKSGALPEPPPTPTLASPPARSLAGDTEDIPKFTFGSSSSTNNLVFTFDSAGSSVDADETVPTFKFGSDKKRELSFDIAGKDAVCF